MCLNEKRNPVWSKVRIAINNTSSKRAISNRILIVQRATAVS